MVDAQEPLVQLGTTFEVSGHKARVTGIAKSGVTATLEGGREIEMDLDKVEEAVTNQT